MLVNGASGLGARGILLGPDGNFWLAIGGNIARVSTTGAFAQYPVSSPNAAPTGIVLGTDGNIWFTEASGNNIGKLHMSTAPPFAPLTLSQSSLAFTCVYGGNPPANQAFNITASTPTSITTSGVAPGSWLSFTPSGSLSTDQTITVRVDQKGYAVGSYANTIVLRGGGATHVVQVKLTVTPATGNEAYTFPTELNYFHTIGGGTSSTSNGLSINSLASSPIAVPFTIAPTAYSPGGNDWLMLTTSGGEPIAGDSIQTTPLQVYAKVNPSGLSAGSYTAVVAVRPTGGTVVEVPVKLTVTPLLTMSASPPSLSFAAEVGGSAPPSQSIQLSAHGGAMAYFADVTDSRPAWLSWSTNSDSNTKSATLVASVSSAGIAKGTYNTEIALRPVAQTIQDAATLKIPITLAVGAAPTVTGVANAASFVGSTIAPGASVTIGGIGLGPSSPLGTALDTAGRVATSLGGVTVAFNGYLAPLTYVSDRQINCVTPYEVAGSTANVQVTYTGRSNAFVLNLSAAAPGIFTLNGSGTGPGAIINGSGGYNGPSNPASAGSTIVFYITGEGQTTPPGVTGKVTSPNTSSDGPLTPQPLLPLKVMIGGQPATVTFFGEAPGLVSGAMQINAEIPPGLPSGELPLIVSLGSNNSQPSVTVSVR